ncbi:MAG: hypothetical protein IJI42_02990 [Methanobrevibacter sp.]|nr:hypothetical protein [Methanobrevibacter sp.]
MAKVKEIVIFLILIVILVGIFGFVVVSVSNLIFPPSQANYGDKIVKDIGSDGILIATLDNCAKVSEKDIPEGYFDTKLITNLSWCDAKNISFVDTQGKKGYMIVWKTSPDRYSVLEDNVTSYISDYVDGINGTCFMEYNPKTDAAYGIIIVSDEINYSEYALLYNILGLDKSEFAQTYSPVAVNGGYGYGYSGGYGHYGGVDTSPYSIVRTDPDWFYDYYDYGDYDDIDEYLESDGYD